MLKVHLLVIDPQNDFCDPKGSLYVPGADADMERLAAMVDRLRPRLNDIHITLDSHREVDVSHPIFWRDSTGNLPAPFTLITAADVENGRWTTHLPSLRARTLKYLRALEAAGKYTHTIWPPHCRVGDWGHNVYPALSAAVHRWEKQLFAQASFWVKGLNPHVEHFSALAAEVPAADDATTQFNTALVQILTEADMVLIAGEAKSHCLLSTVRDLAANFDQKALSKLVLLDDCTSPVPNPPGLTIFSDATDQFMRDIRNMGIQVSTSVDILK